MATWGEFAATAPEIARRGRELLYRSGTGEALLATVREAGLPRIHPIYVAVLDDRLVAFILESPKATDLAEDGRFALHAHQDPTAPHEFLVRGRVRPILGEDRDRIAAEWYFSVSAEDQLFEFLVEQAVFGERGGPDEWPPRYTSWRSPAG